MAFEYIDTKTAMARPGLRMVVVSNVPSPWGEAAKGLFHMKGLDWAAVRMDGRDPEQVAWTQVPSAPVAFFDDEPPRSGWAEIALLAERLAPDPALIPADAGARAHMFGLSHELLGEDGLAWARRLQLISLGLKGEGGFAQPIAEYLAPKYGWSDAADAASAKRVHDLLALFTERLTASTGDYLLGSEPTVADVHLATVLALFAPLPADQCDMKPATRAAFETLDATTQSALTETLIAHRDMMYSQHLETPLSL